MIIIFLVLLAVSGLIDVVLGLWAIVGWGSFASTFGLNLGPGEDIRMMGFMLGLAFLFFAYVQVQAILWIRKEKEDGYPVALAFAGFLVVSSVLMSIVFRPMAILAIDGVRGILLGAFGLLALRSPLTVKELRLPSKSRRSSRRREDSMRDGRRGARGSSTRRPRRGTRREAPARASSRGSGSGPDSRRSSSRGDTRRRGGPRSTESGGRPARTGTDSEPVGRGRQRSSYRNGRSYEGRRSPRRDSNGERGGGYRQDRSYGRDRGGYETERDSEPHAPRRERRSDTDESSRRMRASLGAPAMPVQEETAPRDYREERAPRDHREERAPREYGEATAPRDHREEMPDRRPPREEVREDLEERVVEDVAESSGPPEPLQQRGPKDVVSALDRYESPKGGERNGQNSTDNSLRHRRKTGRAPGASFRPKEKRVRRPLGGSGTGTDNGDDQPVKEDAPEDTRES
jgi:hypothetical protein